MTLPPPDVTRLRIVIVGGGFAGVQCARVLRRRLSPERAEIVIFNRENHLVFHPLLAEVAGGSINPEAVAAPLRQMLPGVRCRTETVQDVDFAGRVVRFEGHDGQTKTMPYGHVVIACGEAVDLALMPGMADHAFPMKTVGNAMALRVHLMRQLERAEVCDDPERRRWYLSFIVVGGGYSGVEAAGEINDLVRGSRRFFQNVAADDIRVTLIHSRDQLLPENLLFGVTTVFDIAGNPFLEADRRRRGPAPRPGAHRRPGAADQERRADQSPDDRV